MLSKALRTALAATTILTGGIALAATEPATAPPSTSALTKDFGKLSNDGAQGFQDLKLTRLAIYDGRIDDAKAFVAKADAAFAKAKSDDTVFTKAEADMKILPRAAAPLQKGASGVPADNTAPPKNAADKSKPLAWLPVDGAVSLNEDYSLQPAKAKAVSQANQNLAKGDRKGALDALRLADVDVSVVTAVVPVNATTTDVHDALQLIGAGKYYEASQKLKAVQDSAVLLVSDMATTPKAAADTTNVPGAKPAGAAKAAPGNG